VADQDYKTNISIGSPPLLWSNLDKAFNEINQNFILLGSILSTVLPEIDFSLNNLNTSIKPNSPGQFSLGDEGRTWKNLYLSPSFNPEVPGTEFNGLWLGSAQVKGFGNTVDLPEGSTVNGNLIIDSNKSIFKTFSVTGQDDVSAETFTDKINFTFSPGLDITTDPNTKTINFSNSGVRSLTGSTYLQVSSSTGNITLTNLGVTSLSAGPGINVTQSTGNINISNTGILNVATGGGGIAVDVFNGVATVTNTRADTLSFRTIRVPGQEDLQALLPVDILNVVPGYAIEIFTSEPIGQGKTLTINFDNKVDIIGSVFADNSTLLVDGVQGIIVAPVQNDVSDIKVFGGDAGEVISTDGEGNLSFIPLPTFDTGNITFTNSTIASTDSSSLNFVPQIQFDSNIIIDGDIVLNGDNRIQADTGITIVPTASAENFGSILNIEGIPAGEGSPGVMISSPSEFIQLGTWVMFSDGGLFSVPLSATPDDPFPGKIYIADGVGWDPSSFANGTPYPVFYDGNDFLPMVPTPSP